MSLSLQRVMPGKKSPSEAERETFERNQTAAVTKAVNTIEVPVKEKHARSIILGSYQENGAGTFWCTVLKLPLQSNPIICWKFVSVLHKVLREGHSNVIVDSQKYTSHMDELGKMWSHLKEGYGRLIGAYTKLLLEKLAFHRKNPHIPGNLQLTDELLSQICGSDVNNYFEITVEMLDYLDEILNLQQAVFSSLDMSRSNSMTSTGQCRLAPLIQCIQDSCCLYDYLVKSLFKLHSSLPPDTLAGHRDRFLTAYKKLKLFYLNSSNLQYFKNLVQVPLLPEEPPNFLVEADFSKHIKPVAVVPEEEATPEVSASGILIETNDDTDRFNDSFGHSSNGSFNFAPEPDPRDLLIEQLRLEIEHLKDELDRVKLEDGRIIKSLRDRIQHLEKELSEINEKFTAKNQEASLLLSQVQSQEADVEATAKLTECQNTLRASDEKFKKMKDIYTKLREEHVELIRTHANITKQLNNEKRLVEEKEQAIVSSRSELDILEAERKIREDDLQKSSEDLTEQLGQIVSSNEQLLQEKLDLEVRLKEFEDRERSLQSDLEKTRQDASSTSDELEKCKRDNSAAQDELVERMRLLQRRLLRQCIEEGRVVIRDAQEQYDNPSHATVTCNAEFLLMRAEPILPLLSKLKECERNFSGPDSPVEELIQAVTASTHHLADCIVHGYATAHSCQIEPGEELSQRCRRVGDESLAVLDALETGDKSTTPGGIDALSATVAQLIAQVEALVPKMEDVKAEEMANLVEDEMQSTTKAIEQAAAKFEEILAKAREGHSGIQLEVNERILDSCTELMKAIHILICRSRDLQHEVIEQGRGTSSNKEFYKKHHRWTEGLISAAKAVGWGASALLNAADKVVMGEGKFEELMVCSQEIAASTAQLVVASKVKSSRDSELLVKVSDASKLVSKATGNVVASAKTGADMIEESSLMDFTKLSLHQTKKFEMQSQVRVLELESLLEKERMKLGTLRRQHYQLAGETEGWDEDMQQAS